MRTPPTKCSFQAALALTLLACSGLAGCSDSQEQSGSNAGSSKAAVVTATPKASGTPTVTATPKGTGTPTATASPTITMTPELEASKKRALATPPPPKPELITVNSDDGAIATAKYWVQLYYYIYTTGKVDEYKALCPGNSATAVNPVKNAIENHSEGGWVEPVTVKFTDGFRRTDFPDTVVIQVNYDRDSFTQYHGDGEIIEFKKESRWAALELKYVNGQWTIVRHKDEISE
mgnify:FL=1